MSTWTGTIEGPINFFGKQYQYYTLTGTVTYTTTTNSDNSITVNITKAVLTWNGRTTDPSANPTYCTACCGTHRYYWCPDFGGEILKSWTFGVSIPTGTFTHTKNVNIRKTLAPGESYTWYVFGFDNVCLGDMKWMTIKNNNTKPANSAPSVSVSCSASATTASMSVSGSCGRCNDSTSCSTRWVLSTASGATVQSGSGTSASFSGLSPNTSYTVTVTRDNGCYSRSSSCSFTTCLTSTLSSVTATSSTTAEVRVAVANGGGRYSPTTQIQYRKCNASSWTNGPTTKTTTIDTVEITGLEDNTCYEFRAITSTSACSYTTSTLKLTTPKKCVQAYISSQNVVMNEKNYRTYNDVKVHYTTFSSPFSIWIDYRVKDGYDKTWYKSNVVEFNEPITTSGKEGDITFRLDNLYPNLVVYEMKVHAEAKQDDCEYEGDIVNFTTPVVPEVDLTETCETLTYLSELVCQSVKKLYKGNISILANPYTVEKCDPYNELPTHLTLLTRLLRFFHAMNCLVCIMIEAGLKAGKDNQYYAGEIGWVDILTEVVEDTDSESWRLVTSGAVKAYIDAKLHEVWHYHTAVDYLVDTLDDRSKLPSDAKSCIVKETNKVYVKSGSSWKEAADGQPDDFAVYHINYDSKWAKAESAWYYFQGTWNNLDADISDLEERVNAIPEETNLVKSVTDEHIRFKIVDENFPCEQMEDGITYIITEVPIELPEHTVSFDVGDGKPDVADQKVTDGAYAQEPVIEPSGAGDFNGWYKDGEEPPAC